MATRNLRDALHALYTAYRSRWTLPAPDALADAARERGDGVETALARLIDALVEMDITFAEWQRGVTRVLEQTGGIPSGVLVGATLTLTQALAQLQGRFNDRVTALSEALASGRIDIDAFARAGAQELRIFHLSAARLGGGMTDAVKDIAARQAAAQVAYWNAFVDDLRTGRMPVDGAARIRQRARLYSGAGQATFADGMASRWGIQLPQRPGDGQTRCRTNCRCHLEFVPTDGGVNVYWRLGIAEHCPDCERLASQWNPLFVPTGE